MDNAVIKTKRGTYVPAIAKAFSSESAREYEFLVTPDQDILVYDDVGRIYTSCHILSERAKADIRRMAVE